MPTPDRTLDEILKEVCELIAPVWPLKDYVAVNPFSGFGDRSFPDTRAFLKSVSDIETLMPLAYFASEYQRGSFSTEDIQAALLEGTHCSSCDATPVDLSASGGETWEAKSIAERLAGVDVSIPEDVSRSETRVMRTLAEIYQGEPWVDWMDVVRDEISKYCAAHYDDGQAAWKSPWKHLPLYQAWHQLAQRDRNLETIGLKGFRSFAGALPGEPVAAIASLLQQLNVPRRVWKPFLCCQAFSILGWASWAKYQSCWGDNTLHCHSDLMGLMAIRLAYDVAIGKTFGIGVDWSAYVSEAEAAASLVASPPDADETLRWILQRALELGFRNQMLAHLHRTPPTRGAATPCVAQMVFCIDVRSERIRRNIESLSEGVTTFGFAGFFGMPIQWTPLGEKDGTSQLPVLLRPKFQVQEGFPDQNAAVEQSHIAARQETRTWRKVWKQFQVSAWGCFSFVETIGLRFAWNLFSRTVGLRSSAVPTRYDGVPSSEHSRLGPKPCPFTVGGLTVTQQADLCEGMLKGAGLVGDLAKLVVLCGHAATTENKSVFDIASLRADAQGLGSSSPGSDFWDSLRVDDQNSG